MAEISGSQGAQPQRTHQHVALAAGITALQRLPECGGKRTTFLKYPLPKKLDF